MIDDTIIDNAVALCRLLQSARTLTVPPGTYFRSYDLRTSFYDERQVKNSSKRIRKK